MSPFPLAQLCRSRPPAPGQTLLEGGADYYFAHYTRPQNDVRAVVGIVVTFGRLFGTPEQTFAPTDVGSQQTTKRATGSGMKLAALGISAIVGLRDGAEISEGTPNGAAALAGLHPGDVINTVNGKDIRTPMELAAELSFANR